MPLYQYLSLDKQGKEHKGTINADSEKLARHKLRNDGMIPVDINAISKQSYQTKSNINIDKRISSSLLAQFTREMSSLITAGLEIEQSLSSVAEQTKNIHLRKILQSIHTRILEGYSFSTGLQDYPKAFPKVYSATIKAGEESGHLGQVLENLAEFLDKQEQMRQKILQAILYPCILIIISFAIVIFLLTYVTPKIISIFEESKQALPLATQILLHISHYFQHYGVISLIFIITCIYVFKKALHIESFKMKYELFLLKLPILGKVLESIETARFLRTLAILTQATVPILHAFTIASELVESLPIRKEILLAKDKVKEGTTIYFALKKSNFFNPSTLQFIANGESSGKLEEMLRRASENQERHVQFVLNSLLTIFEPVLILLMGAIVLFIVLATLLPIFQLSNMVG